MRLLTRSSLSTLTQFELPPLDESRLDRRVGLTMDPAHRKYGTQALCRCQTKPLFIASIGDPIDWDCSGRPPGSMPAIVRRNVDWNCDVETLKGAEDWSRVLFIPPSPPSTVTTLVREMTDEIALQVLIPPVARVAARQAGSVARVTWSAIPLDVVLAYRVYRAAAGGPPAHVGYTEQPAFDDRGVAPGAPYAYTVSAIAADRGGPTRLPYEQPDQIRAFLADIAPVRSRRWTTDGRGDTGGAAQPLPRALYETLPSRSVTITAGDK